MAESLILASSSPRRKELMFLTGIPFETDTSNVDEVCDLPAAQAVAELSRRKAAASSQTHPGRYVLASDTLVSVDGITLGKPENQTDAVRMLRLLSGRTHQVYTGVTVITPDGRVLTETDQSNVTFDELKDSDIIAYVQTGDPLDQAGAYGVQGMASMFISHIDGCFFGVMGLPLYLVRRLLIQAGYPLN